MAVIWILAGVLFFCCISAYFIRDIIFPKVQPYPWKGPDDFATMQEEKKTTVVLAGSYNPPHYGHLAMLTHLSERYKKVVVVIGVNPKKQYAVSPDKRADILRRMIQEIPASNIEVAVVEGYIWRYSKRIGAKVFYRGIRSWEKDGKDEQKLQILNTWGPMLYGPLWLPVPTRFLEGKPEFNHISSTLVRSLCSSTDCSLDDIVALVPPTVAEDVRKLYGV